MSAHSIQIGRLNYNIDGKLRDEFGNLIFDMKKLELVN
jgi:hypothetical protein